MKLPWNLKLSKEFTIFLKSFKTACFDTWKNGICFYRHFISILLCKHCLFLLFPQCETKLYCWAKLFFATPGCFFFASRYIRKRKLPSNMNLSGAPDLAENGLSFTILPSFSLCICVEISLPGTTDDCRSWNHRKQRKRVAVVRVKQIVLQKTFFCESLKTKYKMQNFIKTFLNNIFFIFRFELL